MLSEEIESGRSRKEDRRSETIERKVNRLQKVKRL